MKAIGGYFEIEDCGVGIFPHKNGILLNTGRNALEYILRSIPDLKKVYLPYYTCKVVLEPIRKMGIPFTYYHINRDFEIDEQITLKDGEYIIVNNYYGIKDVYIQNLAKKYSDKLIVDCAQAFFTPVIPGIKMFYSTRKFVGVPDGGVAYCNEGMNLFQFKQDDSTDRLEHLYVRKEQGAEAGFKLYQANEEKLNKLNICLMSAFTKDTLEKIDYRSIIAKRKENFSYLHAVLKDINRLKLNPEEDIVPMIYPFWSPDRTLRKRLLENRIYVATYWPNVLKWCKEHTLENDWAQYLIPLPIDQRYGTHEMEQMLKIILA